MFIEDINYKIQGYHKKKTYDSKGDQVIIEFFADPNLVDGLKIKETRVVTRSGTTGVPTIIVLTIEWFAGSKLLATKIITKNLDQDDGMRHNEGTRSKLIREAKDLALTTLGQDDGFTFIDKLTKISLYKEESIKPLIAEIQNSGEDQKLIDDLVSILNISYI